MIIDENGPQSLDEFNAAAAVKRWILSGTGTRRPESKPRSKVSSPEAESELVILSDEDVEDATPLEDADDHPDDEDI